MEFKSRATTIDSGVFPDLTDIGTSCHSPLPPSSPPPPQCPSPFSRRIVPFAESENGQDADKDKREPVVGPSPVGGFVCVGLLSLRAVMVRSVSPSVRWGLVQDARRASHFALAGASVVHPSVDGYWVNHQMVPSSPSPQSRHHTPGLSLSIYSSYLN